MIDPAVPVDVYCYYRINLAMEDEYRQIARAFQEKYLFRPECLLYQFRRGLDEHRLDTMMECGTFKDMASYRFVSAEMEKRHADLFERLGRVIVGGLDSRTFEFFQAL